MTIRDKLVFACAFKTATGVNAHFINTAVIVSTRLALIYICAVVPFPQITVRAQTGVAAAGAYTSRGGGTISSGYVAHRIANVTVTNIPVFANALGGSGFLAA